jgi:DNA-binding response OmpR family regulator
VKILIVEDEKELSETLREYLAKSGYLCESAATWAEADEKTALYQYDCVLVDITLPGGNGLDLISGLKRNHPKTGIIVISARHSLDDKLKGFDLGADDFLSKPFHLSELNARLRSVLRRGHFAGHHQVSFQEISLFPDEKICKVNEEVVTLTPKEFDLLVYFMANKDRVLTKSAIAEHLWGDDMDSADSFDFIYSHIKNLRKKIVEKGGGDYIQTVYGTGYRFAKS